MNRFFSRALFLWIRRPLPLLLLGSLLFGGLLSTASAQGDDEEEFAQELSEKKVADLETVSDPYKLFKAGQEAHERGELDEALKLYSEAIDEMPEFPEAEYQRGIIFQSRGMLAEAEKSFRNAVDYKRDWTLAMSRLGALLIVNGKTAEAESVLEKSIRLDPLGFAAYVTLTDLYLIEPPPETKLRNLYSNIVYLTSKSRIPASIWACRASLARLLGSPEDAAESVKRALAIEPGDLRARAEQVELLIFAADYEGATAEADLLVKKFPDDAGVRVLLARGLALSGDTKKALDILSSIKDPDGSVTALIASIQADSDVDVDALEMQLSKNPDDVLVLGALCVAMRRSNPSTALDYCRRAFELDRGDIGYAVGYAAALVQLRSFDRAITLLEDLKTRAPGNHTVRANLATAYFESAYFAKAKVEYEWITERRPELPAGFYFLAITHDRLQEYNEAMSNYERFLNVADVREFDAEISRVKLRMPILEKQIKNGKYKK